MDPEFRDPRPESLCDECDGVDDELLDPRITGPFPLLLLLHLAGLEDELLLLLLLLAAIVAARSGFVMADVEAETLVDEDEMMLLEGDEIPVVDKLDLSSWCDKFLYPFTLSTRFLDLSMNPVLSLRLLETQEPILLVSFVVVVVSLVAVRRLTVVRHHPDWEHISMERCPHRDAVTQTIEKRWWCTKAVLNVYMCVGQSCGGVPSLLSLRNKTKMENIPLSPLSLSLSFPQSYTQAVEIAFA